MNTLFDHIPAPLAPPIDAKWEKYKRDFYAAGGTLIVHGEQWLRDRMKTHSAQNAASDSRWIFPHNVDAFVRGILKRGRL